MKYLAVWLLALCASAMAQTAGDIQSPERTAELRAQQAGPHNVVPFDPADFDKYAGTYQLGPSVIATVHRDDGHFLSRLTGQVDVEFFPESQSQFFSRVVPAQISFNSDAGGHVTEMVLHQGGFERHAPRIDEAAAKAIEAALVERIMKNKPSPGTEAALRHNIESMEKGEPDYSAMGPSLAAATLAQWPALQYTISSLGPLKSITFQSVSPGGADLYDVAFERANTVWNVSPLLADGKTDAMGFRRLP